MHYSQFAERARRELINPPREEADGIPVDAYAVHIPGSDSQNKQWNGELRADAQLAFLIPIVNKHRRRSPPSRIPGGTPAWMIPACGLKVFLLQSSVSSPRGEKCLRQKQ
jgi:hypothetical protein